MSIKYILITLIVAFSFNLTAQKSETVELEWQSDQVLFQDEEGSISVPTFKGAVHGEPL